MYIPVQYHSTSYVTVVYVVGAGPVDARSDVARDAGETVVLPYAIQANWTFWVCHTKWVKKGGV